MYRFHWVSGGVCTMLSLSIYAQLFVWQMPFVGISAGLILLATLAVLWRRILQHVFGFESGFTSWVYGGSMGILVLALIGAIPIVFYTSSICITWLTITTTLGVSLLFSILISHSQKGQRLSRRGKKVHIMVFPRLHILSWMYIVLALVGLYSMSLANGVGVLFSPWQSLPPFVLILIFLLTLLLGVIVCSKESPSTVLLLIVVHSVVLHAYMPLSHVLPWGGDVWRHIAAESRIADGDIVAPVLFGPEAKWREVAGADIPEVFVIPQKYTYGQFWALHVILHHITGISFEWLHRWFVPILWALFFPLILFRLGKVLFRSWRTGLVLAWMSFFLFPLQALGSLSLPVSLAVLSFFSFFVLFLQYIRNPKRSQKVLLGIISVGFLFQYALTFLLTWLAIVCQAALGALSKTGRTSGGSWLLVGVIALLSMLFLPLLEWGVHISHVSHTIGIGTLKEFIGEFSGWYYAQAIRPHDILSGNLVFNHTPTYAFVPGIFTRSRWWSISWMCIFFGLMVYGIWRYIRIKQPIRLLLPAVLTIALFGSYVIGWFLFEGDRLFIRRLDPYVCVFFVSFFVFGVLSVYERYRFTSIRLRQLGMGVWIFICAWVGTATYASGPDIQSVSLDEYTIGNSIVADIEERGLDTRHTCILADTWVLFPIEAASNGLIVGGNFPIDYQFGQADRVRLYQSIIGNDTVTSTLSSLFATARYEQCYIIVPDSTREDRIAYLTQHLPGIRWSGSGMTIWFITTHDLDL